MNIALFCSGSGSNAENIVRYFSKHRSVRFPLIVSNKAFAFVHERAKTLGIPSFTFSRADFEEGAKILSLLHEHKITHLVLAGFLVKISPPLLQAYPDRIVNIHPALLPKYGGKGMYGLHVHQAVVDHKETETGITIHLVNEQYDEGAIVFQKSCPILPSDTPEQVAEKVHALEYEYYPTVIAALWGIEM